MKHLVTVTVVVAWIGMAAWLVHKQAPQQTAAMAPLAELPEGASPEREEWFGVFQSGQKIGYSHRIVARTEGGYAFSEDSSFKLAMLGTVQHLQTTMAAETDQGFALRSFRFGLISPAASFAASGTVEGKLLKVRYGPSGGESAMDVALEEPIHLPSTLRPRLVRANAPDGTSYTASVFSPLTLKNEPITLVVDGRETLTGPDGPVEALRISEKHQGLAARAWLAPDGSVLREEATLGFTLERAPSREAALDGITADAPIDLVVKTRIPTAGRIDEPRALDSLTLRMKGSGSKLVPDDPPRQRVEADVLRITRESLPAAMAPGLPPAGADREEVAAYTDPSPFVESDDPAIVSLARNVVGGETEPVAAARKLVAWVHDNVAKEPSLTVPSAREVAKALRGDCNEHAVLLTALARAVGIPSRVVAGAVYSPFGADGLPGQDGFYYHAWSELWLGGWVSADAVFDQMPVDATHVKLLEGGPERHLALAEVIGQLELAAEGSRS
ncbi:MAG: transglutaminase-like domain-containing protein [Thermodesulfobacteriota bacterium]